MYRYLNAECHGLGKAGMPIEFSLADRNFLRQPMSLTVWAFGMPLSSCDPLAELHAYSWCRSLLSKPKLFHRSPRIGYQQKATKPSENEQVKYSSSWYSVLVCEWTHRMSRNSSP
jgi:hypothetical protein